MTLTYRRVKGVQLTPDEADGNMDHLLSSANHTFLSSGTGAISLPLQTVIRSIGKTPQMFGAVGDGVTDDSAAFLLWAAQITSGGYFWIPAATYLFSSQVTVTPPSQNRAFISCYGAVLTTSGAISGIKIAGGGLEGGSTWYGLHVNHDANATATAGIEVVGAVNTTLVDPSVAAGGTTSGYVAILFRNTSTSDDTTGSFWGRVINPKINKRTSTDMTKGIVFRGSSGNAGIVYGGQIANCTTGLSIEIDSGKTTLATDVVVDGVAFSNNTTHVLVNGAATSNATGYRFINSRFEAGTTIFSYTTTTTQPSVPPLQANNFCTSDAGTYLNNPNSLYITILDFSVTPDLGVAAFINQQGLQIRNLNASYDGLTLRTPNTGSGIALKDLAGTSTYATWRPGSNAGGTGSIITGSRANTRPLGLAAVGGISWTDTVANNIRGQATFASAGTKAVSFAVNESDATYYVAISGSANETFWVTSKATTGFTLNSSNASSVAVVDWHLIR